MRKLLEFDLRKIKYASNRTLFRNVKNTATFVSEEIFEKHSLILPLILNLTTQVKYGLNVNGADHERSSKSLLQIKNTVGYLKET